jgi:hypothetical protein
MTPQQVSQGRTLRTTTPLAARLPSDMACVDIHRALDGGVPQQFLLDFDVGPHSTQQARVGMAKRVPANLADANTHGGGFDVPS